MRLSLRKQFQPRVLIALAAIVILAGNQMVVADDGYEMPNGLKPFYHVPGQGKSVQLMMSAYPFPNDGPVSGAADESSDAIRKALRDATSEANDAPSDRLDNLGVDRKRANQEDTDALSFSDLDEMENRDDDDDDEEEDYDDSPLFEMNKDRLARVENGRFVLPPLNAASTKTDDIGNGRIPESYRDAQSSPSRLLPESGSERYLDSKPWDWTVSRWAAPNTFSYPRYFEDRMLERHGHERYPALTPFASGLRFAATFPMLPYLMTLSPPGECESTLGYFRSGSCAPVMHQQPPYSNQAVMVEAAALAAGIIILP